MAEAGQVQEVQRLFLRNMAGLRGFLAGFCPDFDACEDLVHEVFLTASAKAADFAPGTDFPAWLRAIARNKALEHARSRASGPQPLSAGTLNALADDAPPADADFGGRREALRQCLKTVAPRAREILELRYVEGLRPPEIAARVSWDLGAVNVALSRARSFLRDCIGRRMSAGER